MTSARCFANLMRTATVQCRTKNFEMVRVISSLSPGLYLRHISRSFVRLCAPADCAGLSVQLGIDLTDSEFKELMQTIDEDNSNEIDYNEFASSGVLGSKLFAARTSNSGCSTRKDLLEKRK